MGSSSRRKGVAGEAEVRQLWQAAGFGVRGLEGGGDHVVFLGGGRVLHSEVKRAERWKMGEWTAQLEADCDSSAIPCLTMRRNHGRWYALLPLSDLVELLSDD